MNLQSAITARCAVRGIDMSLDATTLIAETERETGLSDWGGEEYFNTRFFELFRAFAHSLDTEAQLHERGRKGAELRLRSILEARLKLVDSRKRDPALTKIKIERPIFILGFARTGSTSLLNLIAQDPALRVPETWEMIYPGPAPLPNTPASDPRVQNAHKILDTIGLSNPEVVALHPFGVHAHDEDQWIMDLMVPSGASTGCWQLPSVNRMRQPEDVGKVYRFHRLVMQNLTANFPGKQVVLKSPGHLFTVKELLEVYPDAVFVQTHRDPIKVMPSVSALLVAMRQCSSDTPQDREKIAMINLKASALGAQKTAELRKDPALNARFLDVHFTDFIADQLGTVQHIYKKFDLDFSPEARDAMQSWLDTPENRPPKGRHTLDQYGLDEAMIDRVFGDYMKTYGIKPER